MRLTFGQNIASLQAQRRLGEATSALSSSFERLSSGQRIAHASDDPAGLAVFTSLHVDARLYTRAVQNANDGLSMLNIADGAVEQLSQITTRLKELAESSANGILSAVQRKALHREGSQLVSEYNRIVGTTTSMVDKF